MKMYLFFSHKLTDAQIEDAKKLGVDEFVYLPEDLQRKFSNIPPELESVKKYAKDFEKFLENAKKQPWFKDTIFVIIADHNGASAGKSSLPLHRYKIPLIIYSPTNVKPKVITKLSSQIDTMPTLFSLLGISYQKKFYGNNILDENFTERAFIGNYEKLGYVKNGYLYFLTPDKQIHKMKINKLSLNNVQYIEDKNISEQEEEEIITYYQSASLLYENSKKTKN